VARAGLHLLTALVAILLATAPAAAQVPIEDSPYQLTQISPRYFGPYAFPMPDNNFGRVCSDYRADLSFDYVRGHMGDYTLAPTFLLNIPLWTDRAVLRVFGEFHEWYTDTPQSHAFRRINDQYPLQNHDGGNLYVSLDLQLLRERKFVPSVALRAIFLTATGDNYETARHYDAPGYAFDLTLGKDFAFGADLRKHVLRPSAGIGFVCWQVDRGTQNDAFLVEAGLAYSYRWLGLSASYGQYTGRIGKGFNGSAAGTLEGDAPKTLTARMDLKFGKFCPFIYFQHGFQDWPFSQFSVGLSVRIPRVSPSEKEK